MAYNGIICKIGLVCYPPDIATILPWSESIDKPPVKIVFCIVNKHKHRFSCTLFRLCGVYCVLDLTLLSALNY